MQNLNFNSCFKNYLGKQNHYFWALTVLFLLLSESIYSQCKLEKKTDEFSSIKTINTQDVTIVSIEPFGSSKNFWQLDMCFIIFDNTLQIEVTHGSQSYSSKLDYINFKFKDGTVLKKTSVVNSGDYKSGHGYAYTYTTFSLTPDELTKFTSSELEKFQAEFTHFTEYAHIENEIKTKNAQKIMKDANCILSEYNKDKEVKMNSKEDIVVASDTICRFEKDIIDDFTKQHIILTRPWSIFETIAPGGSATGFLKVYGSSINGIRGLDFSRGLTTNITFTDLTALKEAFKFNQVDLLLENEEVVTLKELESSDFETIPSNYFSHKIFTIGDVKLWEKLNTIALKKVRLSLNGKEIITQIIDKKFSRAIINTTNCINTMAVPK